MSNKLLALEAGYIIKTEALDGWPKSCYRLDGEHIGAIQAAYFANRPLLVRGDPGLGKSQLALAIAAILDFDLITSPIHYNTTIEDLLYSIDHLQRLHDVQANNKTPEQLAIKNYVKPGKVWQAIAPENQSKPCKKEGRVLLIDEIDKADSTLPNALLEVLNNKSITIPHMDVPITQKADHQVFIVITSNEERLLPEAFLRRCAILDLRLPKDKNQAVEQLICIYQAHCEKELIIPLDKDETVNAIATWVVEQRQKQDANYQSGTSEFLDVIKAVNQYKQPTEAVLQTLKKHLIDKYQ
ncbi:AAA family ATPase [Algibacillus agarilyticus]|uniref:AAA family ATPase n=1 Tax=Algibacillus agarilyticus TaxID=2234133 RepID=UPI000DD018A9|nr:MoxR family ATPase [Algibacillus agarilyticus]